MPQFHAAVAPALHLAVSGAAGVGGSRLAPTGTTGESPRIEEANPNPKPVKADEPQLQILAKQEASLSQQLKFAKQQEGIQSATNQLNASHQKVLDLQGQIQDIHSQNRKAADLAESLLA